MNKRIQEAYARRKQVFVELLELGATCMECTEDKAGIVWERFMLPNGIPVVVVSTPHWWNIFTEVCSSNMTDHTIDMLRTLAGKAT